MDDLPDAKECRERALIFAKHSATFATPEVRDRFARIAMNWMILGFALEQREPDDSVRKRQRA